MKKLHALLLIAALVFSAHSAQASIEVQEDGTREGAINTINLSTGLNGSRSGGTYTVTADPSDITSAVFEGTTADAFETTLDVVDPTADNTFTLPDDTGYAMFSTLATNKTQAANSIWFISNGMVLEGATADGFETTVSPVDPTADQTISIPNNGAASAFVTSALTTNAVDAANAVTLGSSSIIAEGSAADGNETTVSFTNPTADRTVTVPDQTGTVLLAGAATALTPGAAVTLTVAPGFRLYTDTITSDNEDQTITFSGAGAAGDVVVIKFTTDAAGSGDEVITFHSTLVNSTGTLTLANVAADVYTVTFISDGTKWNEIARTAVQTT